jgi:hypothetical protein
MSFLQRKLLKTFEIERLVPIGHEEIQLTARIEVFEETDGLFKASVWFLESYRILPTCEAIFAKDEAIQVSALADKTLNTLEDSLGFDEITEASADLLELSVLNKLRTMFVQM